MSKEKIELLIQEGNEFFVAEKFDQALPKYKAALEIAEELGDAPKEFLEALTLQINACTPNKKTELSPKKQNWFKQKMGDFKSSVGKSVMGATIKGLLPTLKKVIAKNQPKAASFMRGELTMQFQPIPENETPRKRLVIIELNEDPNGDISKDDLIIQVKYADMVRIQVARDDEGNDLSHIHMFAGLTFLNDILTSNLEAAIDDVDFDSLK